MSYSQYAKNKYGVDTSKIVFKETPKILKSNLPQPYIMETQPQTSWWQRAGRGLKNFANSLIVNDRGDNFNVFDEIANKWRNRKERKTLGEMWRAEMERPKKSLGQELSTDLKAGGLWGLEQANFFRNVGNYIPPIFLARKLKERLFPEASAKDKERNEKINKYVANIIKNAPDDVKRKMDWLDVVTFFMPEAKIKNVAEKAPLLVKLASKKNVEQAIKKIKGIKISEQIIKDIAPAIAKADDIKIVSNLLRVGEEASKVYNKTGRRLNKRGLVKLAETVGGASELPALEREKTIQNYIKKLGVKETTKEATKKTKVTQKAIKDFVYKEDLPKKQQLKLRLLEQQKGAKIAKQVEQKVAKRQVAVEKRQSKRVLQELKQQARKEKSFAIKKTKLLERKKAKQQLRKQFIKYKKKEQTRNNFIDVVHQYAKKTLGIPKKYRDKILSQKAVAKVKTGKQLNRLLTKLDNVAEVVGKDMAKQERLKQAKKTLSTIRKEKDLDTNTLKILAERKGFKYKKNYKNMTEKELKTLIDETSKLKKGDRLLKKEEVKALKDYIGKDALKTKREIFKKYGTKKKMFKTVTGGRLSAIHNLKNRNKASKLLVGTTLKKLQRVKIRRKKIVNEFDNLYKKAVLSRLLRGGKKKVWENTWKYLNGQKVELNDNEKKLAEYVKNYFQKAKKEMEERGLKTRKYYSPHQKAQLAELIGRYGLIKGLRKHLNLQKEEELSGMSREVWSALDDIMAKQTFASFEKKRSGKLKEVSHNIDRYFKDYVKLYEKKRELDEIVPAMQVGSEILLKNDKLGQKVLDDYIRQQKGRALDYKFKQAMPILSKGVDKIIDFGFYSKLAFNLGSWIPNLIGGEINQLTKLLPHRYLLGKTRALTRPRKLWKIIDKYALMEGNYVDYATQSLVGKAGKAISKLSMLPTELVEAEMRGTQIAGLLTRKEWKTGKISENRIQKILDALDETQGIYDLERTPLFLKTQVGRATSQFARYMYTNKSMLNKILRDIKKGKNRTKNIYRLAQLGALYGIGMAGAYEAMKTGDKEAEKKWKALQEPVSNWIGMTSGIIPVSMMAENPTIETIREINNTVQLMAYRYGLTDKAPRYNDKQLKDTYIAGVRSLQRLGILEPTTAFGKYQKIKRLPPNKKLAYFNKIKKENKSEASTIKKWLKWDKLKLPRKERDFAYLNTSERAKKLLPYLKKHPSRYEVLREAGIITPTTIKELKRLMNK